jgi:hypothetical protein
MLPNGDCEPAGAVSLMPRRVGSMPLQIIGLDDPVFTPGA